MSLFSAVSANCKNAVSLNLHVLNAFSNQLTLLLLTSKQIFIQSRFKSPVFGLQEVNFSGSKFLINLRRQYRVRNFFSSK